MFLLFRGLRSTFDLGQLLCLRRLLVKEIERIASRHQAIPRRAVVQSLNVRHKRLRSSGRPARRPPASPDSSAPAGLGRRNRRRRGAPRPERRAAAIPASTNSPNRRGQPRRMTLQIGRDGKVPGYPARVLRRQIPVRGRKQGRPLQVRIVIRTSGGDAHQSDAERLQQSEKGAGSVRSMAKPLPSPPKA